ncbi:MAG TPA: hypothetical protein VEX60_09475 [Pyrinomonadaceae bacterium]|nr:hypothetical protein [Pyrinomonadaceae bacterium]
MPGFLLHVGATVQCAHPPGRATPNVPNPRVKVNGQPIVTQPAPWTVAGCTMPPPNAGNGPCVTAKFTTAALRVKSNGQAVLLFDSQATCAPTGTPLTVAMTQTRVKAT